MEFQRTIRKGNEDITLEALIERLADRPEIDGVVMMGSGAGGKLTPTSDIDLLILVNDDLQGVRMISTTVERRLSEVYFIHAVWLDNWLLMRPVLKDSSHEALRLGWIQNGAILFDRSGRLRNTREILKNEKWSSPPGQGEIYMIWFLTNYDLAQTQRLLESTDTISLIKVDLRLLKMIYDLWGRYFSVRQLPALSEKASIRWMEANDPDFLAKFQICLAETDRARKFQLYAELARWVLEPAGGLWPESTTAVMLEEGVALDQIENALRAWRSWLGNEAKGS
jgi:predicted nucleotidyltransferase